MWSDNETNIDYLNYSEVAEVITDMISDESLMPLSVGVYGGWGVGKSSVLKLVERELNAKDDYIVIEFDAWLYQGFEEARSALMTFISTELQKHVPERLSSKLRDLVSRVNKLKFLALGGEAVMAAAGMPVFGTFSRAAKSVQDGAQGDADDADVHAIRDATAAGVQHASGLFSPKEVKSAPEEIAAFREEFDALLSDLGKRLVVFVDNLDRCLPSVAISNLEAMRLFLSMPKTAFIVAADVDMIRSAVSAHFNGASNRHVTDYLDKLIQFPISVPKLGVQEVISLLCMLNAELSSSPEKQAELQDYLIERMRRSWSDDDRLSYDKVVEILGADAELKTRLDTAFRIAPLLAHNMAVSGNPRIIKRMMNVVRMRFATAKRRRMALDEGIITKLALFERCTNEKCFKGLIQLVNQAENGKPAAFLDDAEETQGDGGASEWPAEWNEHADFIRGWLAMVPSLSGIDLRPAVYLTKETVPVQFTRATLPPGAIEAVQVLLEVKQIASKRAKEAVARLGADEAKLVMAELLNQLRKNSDWNRKRDDVNGPLILAEAFPEAGSMLREFLEAIPNRRPWLQAYIRTKWGE